MCVRACEIAFLCDALSTFVGLEANICGLPQRAAAAEKARGEPDSTAGSRDPRVRSDDDVEAWPRLPAGSSLRRRAPPALSFLCALSTFVGLEAIICASVVWY
eukprot:382209-Hanusia_phi.AAC.1